MPKRKSLTPVYETDFGKAFEGKAEDVLRSPALAKYKGEVQLIFTSPPFALTRPKKYGNESPQNYVKWLASYGPLFRDYLTRDGSIVIELGNAWVQGKPTMSTLPIKALLAFQERAKLHLCQEFICYNPARLPTPVEWVARRRIRVKDAFTRLWWMSPTPNPKADNTRVLTKYSASMEKLLKKGTYNPGLRPSEHLIGPTSFLANHGGAIPPNVLIPTPEPSQRELFEVLSIANTGATDPYQRFTRNNRLERHPATMPSKLVEFFLEFLTSPGDLVLDPFAGSNTTGAVAEAFKRNWIAIEPNRSYIDGSRARFHSRHGSVN